MENSRRTTTRHKDYKQKTRAAWGNHKNDSIPDRQDQCSLSEPNAEAVSTSTKTVYHKQKLLNVLFGNIRGLYSKSKQIIFKFLCFFSV